MSNKRKDIENDEKIRYLAESIYSHVLTTEEKHNLRKMFLSEDAEKKRGFVYLFNLKGTDIYKIGFSRKKPRKRLISLQTAAPFQIIEIHIEEKDNALNEEARIKRKYIKYRTHGEWFAFDKNTLKEVVKNIKG